MEETDKLWNEEHGLLLDALYYAWTVIANVAGGDWDKETPEWKAAAEKWRDEHFYAALDRRTGGTFEEVE